MMVPFLPEKPHLARHFNNYRPTVLENCSSSPKVLGWAHITGVLNPNFSLCNCKNNSHYKFKNNAASHT